LPWMSPAVSYMKSVAMGKNLSKFMQSPTANHHSTTAPHTHIYHLTQRRWPKLCSKLSHVKSLSCNTFSLTQEFAVCMQRR
jgi:hypothetical protein